MVVVGALITFVAIDVPGLNEEGPDRLKHLLRLFYVGFTVGAIVSILGYAMPSKTLQIVGILLIFLSTGVFMAAIGAYG